MTETLAKKTTVANSRIHSKTSLLGQRILRLLAVYRLLLAALFVLGTYWLGGSALEAKTFAHILPGLGYLVVASALLSAMLRARVSSLGLFLVDLAFVLFSMHVWGGVGSGLGLFLVVFLLGNASLASPKMALALAAGSSLALLAEQTIQTEFSLTRRDPMNFRVLIGRRSLAALNVAVSSTEHSVLSETSLDVNP